MDNLLDDFFCIWIIDRHPGKSFSMNFYTK